MYKHFDVQCTRIWVIINLRYVLCGDGVGTITYVSGRKQLWLVEPLVLSHCDITRDSFVSTKQGFGGSRLAVIVSFVSAPPQYYNVCIQRL